MKKIKELKKQIKVNCIGAEYLRIDLINPFQGELKELSEDNYKKLKTSFITNGIISAIAVWEDKDGNFYNLDGHQRIKTLTRMQQEGHIIPRVPVNFIDAKDEHDAKEKLLSLASAFGEMSQTSLIDYCQDNEIDFDDALAKYRFADINLTVEEGTDDKEGMENTDERNVKTKTIKVKIPIEDYDEAIEKIKEALESFEILIK